MINEENKIEIIDRYLEGTLPDDQREEVKQRINDDPAFRHEVALHQKIILTVKQSEHERLKTEFDTLYEEHRSAKTKAIPLHQRPIFYYVAASVLLLLIAGALYQSLVRNSPRQTYQGFVAVEVEPTRGESGVLDSLVLTTIDHPDYHFHYQLGDSLFLYGEFLSNDIGILHINDAYVLQFKDRTYPLKSDNEIHLLQP